MSAIEKRAHITNMLKEVHDPILLDSLEALLERWIAGKKEEIVGYEVDGTPITFTQFNDQIEEARAEYERGEYQTQEEVEKQMQRWLKKNLK